MNYLARNEIDGTFISVEFINVDLSVSHWCRSREDISFVLLMPQFLLEIFQCRNRMYENEDVLLEFDGFSNNIKYDTSLVAKLGELQFTDFIHFVKHVLCPLQLIDRGKFFVLVGGNWRCATWSFRFFYFLLEALAFGEFRLFTAAISVFGFTRANVFLQSISFERTYHECIRMVTDQPKDVDPLEQISMSFPVHLVD